MARDEEKKVCNRGTVQFSLGLVVGCLLEWFFGDWESDDDED